MKEIIDSLSLGSGALVVAVVSALLAFPLSRLKSNRNRWFASLLVPFPVANMLYWSPVIMGADSSEFSAWAPLFVTPWYLSGAFASALVVFLANLKKD